MSLTPLNAIQISQALAKTYPRVKVITETTSTQTEISQIFSPLQPFDLLIAEFQTHGRGRLDRTFTTPAFSSLLFSMYLKPQRNKSEWGVVPILIGHAVATAIKKLTGLNVQTKWPNDVLINEKKICGILCEVRGNGIIAGVGLNVNISEDELPVPTASSLSIEYGKTLDRANVLISISTEIHSQFNKWINSEIDVNELVTHSATIGRKVRIEIVNGEVTEGVVREISHDGSLVLESGEIFNVGDVTHLR